jgi:hypothetical protein
MNEPEKPPVPLQASVSPTGRRIDVLWQLLQLHHIRDSLELISQPSLNNAALAGLQAAITVAIALPLIHLSPWSHLIGFASLGVLVALFGRFAPQRSRNRIVFFCGLLQVFAVLAVSTASWLGASASVQLALLALACGGFYFVSVTGRLGPPGALIFVFAAGASMGQVGTLAEVMARTAATGVVAALALLICAATENFRHLATADRPFPSDLLPPLRNRLFAAARIMLGSAIAAYACYAIGARHPSWAAMGALAVMQGANLQISLKRALQRMAGTIVGAFVAWAILTQEPSVWTVIAVLSALQFLTEMIIGVNYGLGQILVAPMALLMSHLAAPYAAGSDIAPERVFDTVLGASIGLFVAIIFSTIHDRHQLAHHHAAQAVAREGRSRRPPD